jgi:hypothetical protein
MEFRFCLQGIFIGFFGANQRPIHGLQDAKPALQMQHELARMVTGEDGDFINVDDGARWLREALAGRRVLLVLDDVWESQVLILTAPSFLSAMFISSCVFAVSLWRRCLSRIRAPARVWLSPRVTSKWCLTSRLTSSRWVR